MAKNAAKAPHVSETPATQLLKAHRVDYLGLPYDYIEHGVIEAIRHATLPWEGWMWHPEREPVLHRQDIERLKALFR